MHQTCMMVCTSQLGQMHLGNRDGGYAEESTHEEPVLSPEEMLHLVQLDNRLSHQGWEGASILSKSESPTLHSP